MKVLIAYDDSRKSGSILKDLAAAGLPKNTQALVLTVADALEVPSSNLPDLPNLPRFEAKLKEMRAHVQEKVEAARKTARRGAQLVSEKFPQWNVRDEVLCDSPAWGILRKIADWKPSLAVLGSGGWTFLGEVFLGGVARQVLSHAGCSVRLSHRSSGKKTAPRILIAIDGSRFSEAAAHAVKERQWPKGTQVRLVSAAEPNVIHLLVQQKFYGFGLSYKEVASEGDHTAILKKIQARAAKELTERGLKVSTLVVEDCDPKTLLLKEAAKWKATSIFMGTKGLRGLESFMLGSVSTAVASHSPCSVEVVR